jgi:hypothetical protein
MLHDVADISVLWHRRLKIFEHVCQPPRLTIRPYRLTTIQTFGLGRDEVKREWKKNYITRSLRICTAHHTFLG